MQRKEKSIRRHFRITCIAFCFSIHMLSRQQMSWYQITYQSISVLNVFILHPIQLVR